MGSRAIWLSCLLLFISFCLMFLKEDIEELEEFEHLEHEEALKNNCAEACRMLYYRVFV